MQVFQYIHNYDLCMCSVAHSTHCGRPQKIWMTFDPFWTPTPPCTSEEKKTKTSSVQHVTTKIPFLLHPSLIPSFPLSHSPSLPPSYSPSPLTVSFPSSLPSASSSFPPVVHTSFKLLPPFLIQSLLFPPPPPPPPPPPTHTHTHKHTTKI